MIYADNTPICSIDRCANVPITRGWCETHYRRWLRTGDVNHYVPKTAEERFWNRVDKKGPNECWERAGANTRGYSCFYYNGKAMTAHRVSWMMHKGPI